MWPRSRSERGFTLTELLVTVAALIVVLTLSAQLLFATRRAADRQRLQTEPRQIARGAVDYANYLVRTATDFNNVLGARNPLAVMTWYLKGDPGPHNNQGTLMRAAYNNVTPAEAASGIADEGTDLITLAHADRSNAVPQIQWQGKNHSSTATWHFDQGCNAALPDKGSADNFALFKELTGGHIDDDGKYVSEPLLIVDANGVGAFYQITFYKDGVNADNCEPKQDADSNDQKCEGRVGCIAVEANPGLSEVNPPSGRPELAQPITMQLGPRFLSLRVCNGWLEQKNGIFDGDFDDNCVAGTFGAYTSKPRWTPLLPNIEDFQVAWVFNNGETRNNTTGSRIAKDGQVPTQGAPNDPYDVTNVAGIRVTATARSAVAIPGEVNNRWLRPAAEDRVAATTRDQFFRYQLSATSMIRNRWVGR